MASIFIFTAVFREQSEPAHRGKQNFRLSGVSRLDYPDHVRSHLHGNLLRGSDMCGNYSRLPRPSIIMHTTPSLYVQIICASDCELQCFSHMTMVLFAHRRRLWFASSTIKSCFGYNLY